MRVMLACLPILLSSCASAVFYSAGKDGNSETVAIAPGLIAKQMLKGATISTPRGLMIRVDAYASRTPDPEVTRQLGVYGITRLLAPIAMEGVKGANAVDLKGTKDPNLIPKDPNIIPVDPQFIPPN